MRTKKHSIKGDFEYEVLQELVTMRGEGYSVSVARSLTDKRGKRVDMGAVHVTLRRLEEKGFAKSKIGETTSDRGGRPKRIYAVTGSGVQAMRNREAEVSRIYAPAFGTGATA